MHNNNLFVSELSASKHQFRNYHFCRGNSNKRKSRLGLIVKGGGTYIYLGKRLRVQAGDMVFIPENIFCYSEWQGEPEIEVLYISCFIHFDGIGYEPQTVESDAAVRKNLARIAALLEEGYPSNLEAYALFYRVLQKILPQMRPTNIAFDKTLQTAIEYITNHWDQPISVGDVAKQCCVSEAKLYHLFRNELGQTPIRFLNSIRINMAIEYLETRDYSVATISQKVGFHSENHFRKVFADCTGTTPLKYKKKGAELR